MCRLMLFMCAISAHTMACAQDPYYIPINKATGLPSNSVYCIFQDRKGFIWITSDAGLTRYDGFEFKTYRNSKQTSRAGNSIQEDKFGRIWYKNFDGYLYYVENDTLRSLPQNTTVGDFDYAILGDRLMVLQKTGLDIMDIATLRPVKSIGMDLSELITALRYKDTYYISENKWLHTISADGTMRTDSALFTSKISGAKNGLIIYERNNNKYSCSVYHNGKTEALFSTPAAGFMQGISYCSNMYWLHTTNGVWVYDDQNRNINNDRALFQEQNTSCVFCDREGNYWLGTLDNGILLIPDIRSKLVTGLLPDKLEAKGDLLYIGTRDNSVYTYNAATTAIEKKFTAGVRHEIICMHADESNGRFYLSSDRFMVADEHFKPVTLIDFAIKDISVVDRKYAAYASSGPTGLAKVRDDIISPWDSLFNATVLPKTPNMCQVFNTGRGRTVAYNPANKTIYTGNNKGLFTITTGKVKEIKLAGEDIHTRRLITLGDKVCLLTPQDDLYAISTADVLQKIPTAPGEHILNIKRCGDTIYALTTSGIKVIDTAMHKLQPLAIQPGIYTEEINDIEIAGGKMMLATERGLLIVGTDSNRQHTAQPSFVINAIAVNGRQRPAGALVTLQYKENDIDISYSILSFSVTHAYKLFYRINDGAWQLTSPKSRNLKLASLSPGQYHISFMLKSDSGTSFIQNQVSINIQKPFWMEWWLWLTCLIALAICGYSYYRWQTRLLNKKNALMLEKVELEKNLRSSMLTSIRAQMNPHFFYNALNTIQSFIFSDDKRNASTYLVKLSRLTRTILEMSDKESITLDEEKNALELYLDLEKMRFTDSFSYQVHVSPNVDSELVKIPSMIVQPYVENAIKHGLLHKRGAKQLTVAFTKDNGNLCVTIDDNGIGRLKAASLNQVKKDKHLPFATYATGKRIDLLNKERKKNIGVVYIDKVDEHQQATGTTVVISIPLT